MVKCKLYFKELINALLKYHQHNLIDRMLIKIFTIFTFFFAIVCGAHTLLFSVQFQNKKPVKVE